MTEAAPIEGQAQAPEGQGTSWTEGLSDESKGLVEVKGWDSPDKAIESYRNLEKLVGADPNQIIKLPKDGEPLDDVYARLGRPESVDGYKIELPDEANIDQNFMNSAKEEFHKLGLSGNQAQELVNFWQEQATAQQTAMQEQIDLNSQKEINDLKTEWGQGYDKMVEQGRRAAREFGIEQETMEQIETAMGTAPFLKLFAGIGGKLLEDNLEGQTNAFGMTPEGANEKINQLKMDEEFMKAYLTPDHPGHKTAVDRMSKLHGLAYV